MTTKKKIEPRQSEVVESSSTQVAQKNVINQENEVLSTKKDSFTEFVYGINATIEVDMETMSYLMSGLKLYKQSGLVAYLSDAVTVTTLPTEGATEGALQSDSNSVALLPASILKWLPKVLANTAYSTEEVKYQIMNDGKGAVNISEPLVLNNEEGIMLLTVLNKLDSIHKENIESGKAFPVTYSGESKELPTLKVKKSTSK